MMSPRWTIALIATALGVAPAFAQRDAPADPKCAVAPQAPRADQNQGDRQTTGRAGENLSEQLARSDGVICPPGNVDPKMDVPVPEAGRTPVIPPPGSPGGDPTVRPK
jgi:hypothetical protein